jgi:hypothetical protein
MKIRIAQPAVLSTLLVAIVCQTADASIWMELGDAGDTLATANNTAGIGVLNSIVGTLPDQPDDTNVDLFLIYIPDLSLFSATTDNGGTELLESWLYLFDASGMGVAASGSSTGSFNATISLGSLSGPAGIYYLAVTRFDTVPQNASGAIFPDLFSESTSGEVLGPTGPGGGEPLANWAAPDFLDSQQYQIDLSGAQFASEPATVIPEPASSSIWLAMFLTALLVAGHRRFARRGCAR